MLDADEDEEPELGPDGDLVSAMITTALIPRLSRIIEGGGFDPYSATDIRHLVDLGEEIEVSVDRQNQKFEVRQCSSQDVSPSVLSLTPLPVWCPADTAQGCLHGIRLRSHVDRIDTRTLPRAQPASVRPRGDPRTPTLPHTAIQTPAQSPSVEEVCRRPLRPGCARNQTRDIDYAASR